MLRIFFNIFGYLGFVNFVISLGYFIYFILIHSFWGPLGVILTASFCGLGTFICALIIAFFVNIIKTRKDEKIRQSAYLAILSAIKTKNSLLTIIKIIGIAYSAIGTILTLSVWLGTFLDSAGRGEWF